MKTRKPRTAVNRKWNQWIKNHPNNKCDYFDGFTDNGYPITECNAPWCGKCKGNIFECGKLKNKYWASQKTHD